ncbi:MAG: hypothetical protein HUJ98_12010, partial [Bacteroidaceae bacterium]|nr:hypothetical protein [Bacteroidaceae bacterium]
MIKRRYRNRIISALVVGSLLMTQSAVVYADRSVSTIEKDQKKLQGEINELDEELYAVVLQIEETTI